MSNPRPTQGGSYIRDPKTGALLPQGYLPPEGADAAPSEPSAPAPKGGK